MCSKNSVKSLKEEDFIENVSLKDRLNSFFYKKSLFANPVTIFSPTSFFMLYLYPKKQWKR
jgi:hypothetical protein